MHLDTLQHTFQQYLIGDTPSATLLASIAPVATGNVSDRLNIYHHAYRARTREALSSQFPNLNKWLSNDVFNRYVDGFIAQHPSNYRNMRWLGDKFSEYLHKTTPEQPMYGDMANFEWQLGLAFDAADTPFITLQDISSIPPAQWGELAFEWHPSVYLGHAQTNVMETWKALESNADASTTNSVAPLTYLIWRKHLTSQFKSIHAVEASAIAYMLQNHTFGELCDLLATQLGEDKALETAAGLLSDWLQQEMLVGLKIMNAHAA